MTYRDRIVARLTGAADSGVLFLPDLTLWHRWHQQRHTLPAGCGSLAAAAHFFSSPSWIQFKAWNTQYEDAEWITESSPSERIVRFRARGGELTARWTLGPDGDWWQTEYPVKTEKDVEIARDIVRARVYVLDDNGLAAARAAAGCDGVIALELPMRPYSDLLHTLFGWGEGLTLMVGQGRELVDEMLAVLDHKLHELTAALAVLPGDVWLAPDNLDGQYISPRTFNSYLAPSYTRSAEIARRTGRPLVVHVGGPARRLVPLLADAGVDAVEGIAGAPQGDVTLAEARASAGPGLTLWGGIPQDYLSAEWEEDRFEAALQAALQEAEGDSRAILGVADRVPVDALPERLARIAQATR